MNKLHITYQPERLENKISFILPPSKSILARKLILAKILNCPSEQPPNIPLDLPEDILALQQALSNFYIGQEYINVLESGTAMRFMTAFIAASCKKRIILMGTGRQHQRPIAPLVEALRSLGADINYLEQEGYPPLEINPSKLIGRSIEIDASQSSQYLSALLLIAPLIESGNYEINLKNNLLSSAPYAQMTIEEMNRLGLIWKQIGNKFRYFSNSQATPNCSQQTEADWTAASYPYLLMSLLHSEPKGYKTMLHLQGLCTPSSQGDSSLLPIIYQRLGVHTANGFRETTLSLMQHPIVDYLEIDCLNTPDLVPSLVASLVAQAIPFTINGVAHLRIKESDRLTAIAKELAKVGIHIIVTDNSLIWSGGQEHKTFEEITCLNPHNDHRIAMALAPLIAKLNPLGVIVEQADCIKKSFPLYWRELSKLGYSISTISN